jgi:hypothetical protein
MSCPRRMNLLFAKKYCSDINLFTQNILDGLPGEYRNQLELSASQLAPFNSNLNTSQKQILARCREQLINRGEHETAYYLEKIL